MCFTSFFCEQPTKMIHCFGIILTDSGEVHGLT